ncbi:glucose-6-phosphate isomerase [Bordetella holmesii]|uniref:glucose-6-phosphate isomerase n=1 Tax=Bordetella holmesii TaxID=35814 RepID=UPI000C789D9B|nr:glucose-6-phosphate isomerase [Bordetella holmesii]AUL20464.1 glucose-6-phosphate isomerase [Bordetella holmesii]AUL51794.1 glucose-6-phosphate isomerase [Bordetella holmesii]
MTASLSSSPAWRSYAQAVHEASHRGDHLRVLEAAGLSVDLTAQAYSASLDAAALALCEQQGLTRAIQQLFDGGEANWTEHRPAWHTALRAARPPASVAQAILTERQRVRDFVAAANANGDYKYVLHLGIGGSDWGPRMILRALRHQGIDREVRFASNVDSHAVADSMHQLDPHSTLIIIASKSFTTTEPLANAQVAIHWLEDAGVADPLKQVVAITANVQAARDFGIAPEHIFQFWDWVGGRYSLWSAIGALPISLALGCDTFDQLLAGAADMDEHFLRTPLAVNAPVQMALAGMANRSVMGFETLAMAPYDSRLTHLVPWAQQLEMESLGKVATRDGSPAGVPTGPVVWGMTGTDCQHTFFQWLHQDTAGAPVDFIFCERPDHRYEEHHRLLIANCLAQRAALLRGKSFDEALVECSALTNDPQEARVLAQHRIHPGRRPSTLIVLPRLTARTMGALLALYEHKVFTQGVLWGINPFDQWGVEFGKALARRIIDELGQPGHAPKLEDPSTRHWIEVLSRTHSGA